jgi:putative sigma-54 modulation protein
MKIDVRFLGLPSSAALREHVERQAVFHLSRFGHDVEVVEVRVRDINGPRGGDDMECKVSVKGPRVGFTTITELSGDMYQSVGAALSRQARAVARLLERARAPHPSPHLTN